MKTSSILSIALSLVIILFDSCGSNLKQKSPEELRAELKTQEQSNPTDYLTIINGSTSMKHNLVREAGLFRNAEYDGYMVAGTIQNTATLARFKDVILTITLFSQTETVISEENYTIYEFFEPNSTNSFSIKVNPPEATDKYNVSIRTATPID